LKKYKKEKQIFKKNCVFWDAVSRNERVQRELSNKKEKKKKKTKKQAGASFEPAPSGMQVEGLTYYDMRADGRRG
jgi:hypothetical protein